MLSHPVLFRARRWALAALAALSASGGLSCWRPASQHLVDAAMGSAYRPDAAPRSLQSSTGSLGGAESASPEPFQLLAGDLHCHVAPPDGAPHVTRGAEETVALARSERLDFVVLTPHVGALFFQDEESRAWVRSSQAELRRAIRGAGAMAPTSPATDPIFIYGMEYTDHTFGHVGAAFADVDAVLNEVSAEAARARPELFFERFVARGGVLVVNHPLVTPVDSIIPMARADLSWRPFTSLGPFPPEILAVDRLAQGFEAYNLTATHLRDRYLVGDTDHSLRATVALLDREIHGQSRRMTPVGGSDSHSGHLRATTFVLSRGRTEAGIRDAIVAGRVCVREPAACSLEARAPGGPFVPIGSSIQGVGEIDVRARGDEIDIRVNGDKVAEPASGEVIRVPLRRGHCSVVRAIVDGGYAAPIYVNCPFAG